MIYFDAGATTLQKPPQVARAAAEAITSLASPGRGGHKPAMAAAEQVYLCRELAAKLFEARAEQVVFTMNATHGLNLAIKSLIGPGDRAVISGFEHNAVVRPLYAVGAKVCVAGRRLFDPEDTLAAFERAITPDTKAVICTYVSNVFGYVLPIRRIAALCRQRRVPLIVDASQAAGALPVSLKELGAAFIAMPGHKGLYGPQGTGILLCGQLPKTLLEGGSGSLSISRQMPDFLPDIAEAGTHNVCGICGLAEGLRFVLRRRPGNILIQEQRVLRRLSMRLKGLPDVELFEGAQQSGVLSFRLKARDCEDVARYLAEKDICVRAGLHCAPLAHESAGTLDTGTVRVSVSVFNTEEEAERFAAELKKYPGL